MKAAGNDLSTLRICNRHLDYDNSLHPSEEGKMKIKSVRSANQGVAIGRHCLFCNKYKCFFTRGNTCLRHIWEICNRTIQVPCRGLFNCLAITKHDGLSDELSIDDDDNESEKPHFICTDCYITNGGYLHIQPKKGGKTISCQERGEHNNDATFALKEFSK